MIITLLEMGISNALVASGLAIVAFAITRHMRPQWALAIWLLVLTKLLMPPLWTVPLASLRAPAPGEEPAEFVSWNQAGHPVAFSTEASVVVPETQFEPLPITEVVIEPAAPTVSFPALLLAVWGIGTVCWGILAVRRIRGFSTLLKHTQVAPRAMQAEIDTLAAEIGLCHAPALRITRRRIAPLVWAFSRRSTILLPAALLEQLSPDERRALLLHELTHLRRRDHLAKLLELAAVAVYWWLPTAWLARRQADRATEGCCDAEVVTRLTGNARSYASALVKTIDYLSETTQPLPLGASGFSQFGLVSRRIEMILQPLPVRRASWKSRLAIAAIALLVLPVSIGSLWADPPAPAVESQADLPPAGVEASSAVEQRNPLPVMSDAERAAQYKADLEIEHVGPVGYEDDPQVKIQVPKDASLLTALYLAQNTIKMNAFFKQYFGKTSLQQAKVELAQLEQKATERWQLKMIEIRNHLRTHLATIEKKFAAGEVTVDTLIAVQQQFAEREAALARAVCPRDWSGEVLRMQANYMIACESLNCARKTWKVVHQQAQVGAAEAAAEALAREHFYQCKQQTQNVMQAAVGDFGQHVSQADPDRDIEIERLATRGVEWRMFSVAGPTTAGPPLGTLEPPSDEQVLKLLHRKLFADGRSAIKSDIQLFKELRATYADEPRAYPEVGQAQRHHAIYKCTVGYVEPSGNEVVEVVYLDHQHLHRTIEPVQQAQFDKTQAQAQPQQAAEVPDAEGTETEVLPSGGKFVSSAARGKDWISNEQLPIDKQAPKAKSKSSSSSALAKSPFQAEMNRVPIVGPVTTGDKVAPLDPPSDDDVLRALAIKVSGEHRSLPGKSRRIVKELVATYTDPPKWHAKSFGKAQLHHAHYKCTIYYDDPQGKPREVVVYVDHNHFHRKVDSRSFDKFQSGQIHYTSARGVTRQVVQFRHYQLQLAREEAKLADLKRQIVDAPTPEQHTELSRLEMRIAARQQELNAAAGTILRSALSPVVPLSGTSYWVGQER